MRTPRFVSLVVSALFSVPALAGGVTGGTGLKTSPSTLRLITLDKLNFKALEVQSLRGLPVNIEGESHLVDSIDLDSRAIVLSPESGEGDPLVVKEESVTEGEF